MLRMSKDGAEVSLREWTPEFVGGGWLQRDCTTRVNALDGARQGAVQTGRLHRAATHRPICFPRIYLEQKPRAGVADLVELEPLIEL